MVRDGEIRRWWLRQCRIGRLKDRLLLRTRLDGGAEFQLKIRLEGNADIPANADKGGGIDIDRSLACRTQRQRQRDRRVIGDILDRAVEKVFRDGITHSIERDATARR